MTLQFVHHFHPFRFLPIHCNSPGFPFCKAIWTPCTAFSAGHCHNVAVGRFIHYSSCIYWTIVHVHAMRKLQSNQPYLSWKKRELLSGAFVSHTHILLKFQQKLRVFQDELIRLTVDCTLFSGNDVAKTHCLKSFL